MHLVPYRLFLGTAFADFRGIVGSLVEIFIAVRDKTLHELDGWFQSMGINLGKFSYDFQAGWKELWDNAIGILGEIGKRVLDILDPSTWVQTAFADDGSTKSTVDSWVQTNITDPINGFLTYITVTAEDIWKQIESGAQGVVSTVNTWINTNIVDPINQFIQNISVTASEIWTQIVQGAGSIVSQVTTWVNKNIVDPIDKFIDNITVTASGIWTKIVGSAGAIAGTVNTWINGNIVEPINNLYQRLTEQAGSIIDKLLNGDYVNQIVSWAKEVGAKIASEVLAAVRANPIGAVILDALGIGKGTASANLPQKSGLADVDKKAEAQQNAENAKAAQTRKETGTELKSGRSRC